MRHRFAWLEPPLIIEDNPAVVGSIDSSRTILLPRRSCSDIIRNLLPIALSISHEDHRLYACTRAGLRLKIARCRCLTKPVSFGSASLGVYTKVVCESALSARLRESGRSEIYGKRIYTSHTHGSGCLSLSLSLLFCILVSLIRPSPCNSFSLFLSLSSPISHCSFIILSARYLC